jgi:MarR family transcriptional regulator, organic hydroperoxide resistance regulator
VGDASAAGDLVGPAGASLSQLLAMVAHRVSTRVETALSTAALTLDQWRVLALLSDGRGHSMSQIAAHVMVPAPTLTKIVDRLVEAALVHRTVDSTDRRRVLVLASAHGAELHERLAPEIARVEEGLTAELDAADAAQLMRLLARLAAPPLAARTLPVP